MRKSLPAVIEQLLLSGLNLMINLALLATSTKAEYAAFVVWSSYLLLAVSIQTAVLSTPMMVEISHHDGKSRDDKLAAALWLLVPMATCVAGIAMAIAAWITADMGTSDLRILCISFGLAMAGTWLREFARTTYVVQDRMPRSLFVSSTYATLVIAGLATAYLLTGVLTAATVFGCLAVSALLVSVDLVRYVRIRTSVAAVRSLFFQLGQHARWATPGVLVIWLQNNAYLSIVASWGGANLTADLAAARLFVMPYLTAFAGYARPLLGRFTRQIAAGQQQLASQAAIRLSIIQLLLGGLLAATLWLADWLQLGNYLGNYAAVLSIAVFWALFAGMTAARAIWSSLGQAAKRFKLIFYACLVSATLVVTMLFAPFEYSAFYPVLALTMGEAILLVYFWAAFRHGSSLEHA
jgi:O-antigen/teichoic acid export membrane protein